MKEATKRMKNTHSTTKTPLLNEIINRVSELSIQNQNYVLALVKGLERNSGYYTTNYRREAIKRLVMADIPTTEENIRMYIDESKRYLTACKKGTPKIEGYPLICKVKQAIDASRKAPVEV